MSVKVAIIGAGGMADYHYKGFVKAGAEVAAIADTNKERAAEFAEKYGIKNIFSSLDETLESKIELDAVSVITPNKFHFPLAKEALERGLSVYVEKPPVLNYEEMEKLYDVWKKSGKVLIFDFNNRMRPETIALKKYIDEGTVGKINSAQALWIRRSGIPGFGGWFTNKALSGGGAVMDLPHMTDLALYYMGYPEPVYVSACTFSTFMGDASFKGPWGNPDVEGAVLDVETACHAFVRFKGGSCLYIRSSWAEMNEREEVSVTFQGTKAGGRVIRVFDEDGIDSTSHDRAELYTVENSRQVNREIIFEKDETMGRVDNAAAFIYAVEGKARAVNTPDEALVLMRILDAIYKSSETGRPVLFV